MPPAQVTYERFLDRVSQQVSQSFTVVTNFTAELEK
jgi:hypothetical protein